MRTSRSSFRSIVSLLIVGFLIAIVGVTKASAAPIVDGVLSPGDGYGAPVKVYSDNYVNGKDASDGTNVVSQYFAYDANYVYGAIHLDSGPSTGFTNIYFYSGSANTNTVTGTPGSYGDGNDIIVQGTSGWAFLLNDPPYATATTPLNPATVNAVSNGSDTVEFSIARSLLGTYDSFRYGGQHFAYEFHTGGDRVDGPIVSVVPEPTTLAALGGASLTLLRRRRIA